MSEKSQTPETSQAAAGSAPDHATRARIVAGARLHFFAHGFRGVTMDDLAEEMRMSKKTLYVHFSSKRALVEAVLQDKLARAQADFQKSMEQTSFSARLEALLGCMREHGEEIQPPFMRDMQREAAELFSFVVEGRTRLIHRYFGQLFQEGQQAGHIRRDVKVEFLIEMLIGAVNGVLTPGRMLELGMPPKVGFAKVISIFMEGAQERRTS